MFPFTLSGPAFLLFYGVATLLLLLGYWIYRQSLAAGGSAQPRLATLTEDPYRIACLRGGDVEMVRLAVVNLVDRGLLEVDSSGVTLQAKDKASVEMLRRPLDRALLSCFATRSQPGNAMLSPQVRAACEQYRRDLVGQRLLLDDQQRRQAFVGLVAVLGVLGGIALVRLLQAFSRGQGNVVFLLIAAALACWLAYRIGAGDLSAAGKRALGSLQTLMTRLKARADALRSGGVTNEALLLAAVFGIHALPADAFPFIEQLYPRPVPSRSDRDSGGSGCGSSSCGGGGGGGCGGCGGD